MEVVITFLIIGILVVIYITLKDNVDLSTTKGPFIPPNATSVVNPEKEAYQRKQKYTTYFTVAGIQYYDYDIAAKKRLFKDATQISLKRQPKNRKDSNAIEVYFADLKIGYVPRYEASKLAPQFDRGDKFTAYLESYNSREHYDERIEIELVNDTLRHEIEGF